MQFIYPRLAHLTTAPITFSGSGDNIIVAAVSGKRILVERLWLVVGAATNLTFLNGGTPLSGVFPMAANGGMTFDISGEPWFVTDINTDFIINSSGAVVIGGQVYYHLGT